MRVAPVVWTNSSSRPQSAARSFAVSTSEPVGWRLGSSMPDGGIAMSVATLIFLAAMMSASASAAAGAMPAASVARTAAAAVSVFSVMWFLP